MVIDPWRWFAPSLLVFLSFTGDDFSACLSLDFHRFVDPYSERALLRIAERHLICSRRNDDVDEARFLVATEANGAHIAQKPRAVRADPVVLRDDRAHLAAFGFDQIG